jgi:hypothetical protein
MASSGKKKTTMAKLNRERKLRERRLDKQARKEARKAAAAQDPETLGDVPTGDAPTGNTSPDDDQYDGSGPGHANLEPVVE